MRQEFYQQYIALKNAGRKQDAKKALECFLRASVASPHKQQWAWEFLRSTDYCHKIRHEMYEELVFPVLLEGYHQRDAQSILWLAKTIQNLYSSRALHAKIDFKSETALLSEAYSIEPDEETRTRLLHSEIRSFEYCQHEWPAGILYGHDGATGAECQALLHDVSFARELDTDHTYQVFLQSFEQKVKEYQQRLKEQKNP